MACQWLFCCTFVETLRGFSVILSPNLDIWSALERIVTGRTKRPLRPSTSSTNPNPRRRIPSIFGDSVRAECIFKWFNLRHKTERSECFIPPHPPFLLSLCLAQGHTQSSQRNMSQPMMKALYYSSVCCLHRASRPPFDAPPPYTSRPGTSLSRRSPSLKSKTTKSCSKVPSPTLPPKSSGCPCLHGFISVVTYCGVCGVCTHDFISTLGN